MKFGINSSLCRRGMARNCEKSRVLLRSEAGKEREKGFRRLFLRRDKSFSKWKGFSPFSLLLLSVPLLASPRDFSSEATTVLYVLQRQEETQTWKWERECRAMKTDNLRPGMEKRSKLNLGFRAVKNEGMEVRLSSRSSVTVGSKWGLRK